MGSIDRRDSTPQLLNRLRMRQVALLLAVDERRTLRAASTHLGLTQPAATKMLQELESALGQPLFERIGRGLRLNAAGARVVGYFRGIQGSMESLNRELHEMKAGSAGKFALGSIMAASPGRLTDALTDLKAVHPLLAIEIAVDTSDRLLAQLNEGVLEIVIGRMTGPHTAHCSLQIIEDEALAVVAGNAHPLARKRRVPFAALLDYPWILQPAPSPMRELMEREFESHHAPLPRGLIETGSILTTINLIRKSQMISVIPATVAQRDADHGLLSILNYPVRQKLSTYGSIVRTDRPLSPAAREFLHLLHRKRGAKSGAARTMAQ